MLTHVCMATQLSKQTDHANVTAQMRMTALAREPEHLHLCFLLCGDTVRLRQKIE